jgi:hypothetical protein
MTSLDPFVVVGDVTINDYDGFTDGGSPDTSAATLIAVSSLTRKRQNGGDIAIAALKQMLSNLNTRTRYTVQFYYHVANPPRQTTSCVLEAFIGSQKFYTTGIFYDSASDGYNQVLVSTSVPASRGFLNIQITCASGDRAAVLIDSIFISNQVSVENIGDYRIDFGNGVVREPSNLPATTQSAQMTSTEDNAATTTEVASEGTTASGGNGNEQGTTQTALTESQPTVPQIQSEGSDVTSSAAEETSTSTTTTGFPTEETITPIRDARPVQEDCLGQNLIDNGDFEDAGFGAGDGWDMYGNAVLTYNGQFGPNSRTNSGESAVAIRWPQANGVRAAFKRTVPNVTPGLPYLFGWAYHVASGDVLPDNVCTITARFGDVDLAPVDPFSIANAWINYRNIMNHVSTPDTEVEVVFELSCSGNPRPFTIVVDDVFLAACQK